MTSEMITREFDMIDKSTCKWKWTFSLERTKDVLIVQTLVIDEREKQMGCQGHPKTIVALLKGMNLLSIDPEGLANASCGRETSCCQILAMCIAQLKEEMQ